MSIGALVDNPVELRPGLPFAAIIGLNPSKGARSPLLWNAAFAAHGSPSRMVPLDVTAERLTALLTALDANADFIGGAVAMPHKETIAAWLGERIEPEAAKIGAVNCLFRRDGRLWGTNTDGAAALHSLAGVRDLAGARVALLGPGGAGKAVAAYVATTAAKLTLVARDSAKVGGFAAALGADLAPWPPSRDLLAATDVVINCTSVGSAAAGTAAQSPLSDDDLAALPADAAVYDIIYDPAPTTLLTRAAARRLRTLDGAEMNLLQAVLAFAQAAPQPQGAEVTRIAMRKAKQG